MCPNTSSYHPDNIGGVDNRKTRWCVWKFGKVEFLQFYQPVVGWVASGGGGQRRVTPEVPTLYPGISLVHSRPILGCDWPIWGPGDHPWPRAAQSPGTHLAHEALLDTRTCSTKYCPWSTGSPARIINHIIQRNETCALDVSTGACKSMSLIHFTLGNGQ